MLSIRGWMGQEWVIGDIGSTYNTTGLERAVFVLYRVELIPNTKITNRQNRNEIFVNMYFFTNYLMQKFKGFLLTPVYLPHPS